MANNLTKKQVWRETVPTFTRVIMGIIIFFGYLGTAIGFISFLILLTRRQHIIEGLQSVFETDLAFNSYEFINVYLVEVYYAIGSAKTVFTLLMIFGLIGLLISLGSTIWLHFGKSRVIISIFFVEAVLSFLYSIVILIDGKEVLGLGIRLVIFLMNTIILIIYMNCVKATYRYHYFLKKEIQFQENKLRQSRERNEPYPITKPRLQESIYTAKESKPKDDVIRIDNLIDKAAKEGNKSIYGETADKKEDVSNSNIQNIINKKADDKQQQSKARIRIEKEEDILGNNANDARYEMEKRPLLSSIKENIEAENTKEEIKPIEEAEAVEPKEEINPMEEVEAVELKEEINPMEEVEAVEPKEEVNPIEEVEAVELKEEINPMEEVETVELKEEINPMEEVEAVEPKQEAKPIEAEISEGSMESEQTNIVVDITEPEAGIKVDTSLGYRRITFDDL